MADLVRFKEHCPSHPWYPSIMESFQDTPYEGQEKIIQYLETMGERTHTLSGMPFDVVDGTIIKVNGGRYVLSDGENEWVSTLSHYVKKYNLRLPREFEEYIINGSMEEFAKRKKERALARKEEEERKGRPYPA